MGVLASPSAGQVTLSSTGFDIGQNTTVTTTGPSGAFQFLMFDSVPGSSTLPGGAWLGLEVSTSFRFLDYGMLPGSGTTTWTVAMDNDPGLVGATFYLQSLVMTPKSGAFQTSNRLDEVVGAPSTGAVIASHPNTSLAVEPGAVFEIWVDTLLRDYTVNTGSVTMTDSQGRSVALSVGVEEGSRHAVIHVVPNQAMPRGETVTLSLASSIRDESGGTLSGPKQFTWSVAERVYPILFNTPAELALYTQRINNGQDPWEDSFDYLEYETDTKAMSRSPRPYKGTPPTSFSAFLAMYTDWFTDSRYAEDLAYVYRVTGDTKYADKAVQLLTAWTVFDPAMVGSWYWSIQFDVAGISYLTAADLMWDYPGLTDQDRAGMTVLLKDLAATVQLYQLDTSDMNPGNIRSWNNTLIASVGWFLEDQALVDWALDVNGPNPFPFFQMFDDAMAPDGEMYDSVRGKSTPYEGVTYPAFHLQAWSLLSKGALHHGVDLYTALNADGNSQLAGWQYLIPYLDGTIPVSGLTQRIIRDFAISKYYPIQTIYRDSVIDNLFDLYGGEPHYETHVFKKAASFIHNLPPSLLGPDTDAPFSPTGLAVTAVGARTVSLAWADSRVGDEGDFVFTYYVFRNGALVGESRSSVFTDTSAPSGTACTYAVVAMDSLGNLSLPAQVEVTTRTVP